ncbi:MAG: antiterminator LoaP [Clostridiales bacterium]|nr:antiterminator LoaP [Clostridiales bacterium]
MWYVIWTSSSHENTCVRLLEEKFSGLYTRVFIPTRTISKKRGSEWQLEQSALFPGYIFVDSDRIEDLADALRFHSGFNIVLSTDGGYLPLTEEESAFAEDLYGRGGNFDTSVGMIDGDEIKVTGGPLVGLEGFITKIDRHKRIAFVEVNMFGKKIRTKVGLEIVERR